jgi:hypothetical protein
MGLAVPEEGRRRAAWIGDTLCDKVEPELEKPKG